MLKFAYGVSGFQDIILSGSFYQDRTGHIPAIEAAGKQLLFLRPRRFGKSLLLSMLENYYDLAKADQFERLFGHLAIGQNPTPRHNQYFILRQEQLTEARRNLTGYYKLLKAEYPQAERWRAVAIVAIAFERLVWEVVV